MSEKQKNETALVKQSIAAMQASAQELAKQGYTSTIFHKLEEGESIAGLFVGAGPEQEIIDENSGEVRYLPTWLIQSPDGAVTVRMNGSYGLNQFFRGLTPGNTLVAIKHKGQRNLKTRRVNDYETWSKVDVNREPTGRSVAEIEAAAQAKAKAEANAPRRSTVQPSA